MSRRPCLHLAAVALPGLCDVVLQVRKRFRVLIQYLVYSFRLHGNVSAPSELACELGYLQPTENVACPRDQV